MDAAEDGAVDARWDGSTSAPLSDALPSTVADGRCEGADGEAAGVAVLVVGSVGMGADVGTPEDVACVACGAAVAVAVAVGCGMLFGAEGASEGGPSATRKGDIGAVLGGRCSLGRAEDGADRGGGP